MKLIQKIFWFFKGLFRRKEKPVLTTSIGKQQEEKPVLTKAQKRNGRIQAWANKPYTGKAHKMPLAKFLNPEKYF